MTATLNQLARNIVLGLLLLAAAIVMPAESRAQSTIESLVEPDLLSAAHAKLESDCSACHKSFKKAAQSSLCADCHKPVKQDVAQGTGFHGKEPLVAKSECVNCHAEHKGRAFHPAAFTEVIFDHRKTDFALEGKHADVECSSCHKAGKRYAEAPVACSSCHQADQPHQGRLGTKCESCHGPSDWRKVVAFDHGKTKFALIGAHAKATCHACHAGEFYKELPANCVSCHAMQDVHEARFGEGCEQCHSSANWKHTGFDHGKFTKFPLAGAHATAACSQCHGAKLTSKLPLACVACHQKQDLHRGQLGDNCAACHQTAAWRSDVLFDHALTRFPLTGQHAAVACEACHTSPAFKDAETACVSCHKDSDVHEGRLAAKCEACHAASAWKLVTFSHDRDTGFKLTGVHAKVGCNGCHVVRHVVSAKLPKNCHACHKRQDVHKGAFGQDCARCHSTRSFRKAVIPK